MINEITKYRSELSIKDFHLHNQGTIANIYAEMITGILKALKYNLIFESRDNIVIKHNSVSCCYNELSFDIWLKDFLLQCKIQNPNYAKSEQFLKLIKKRLGDTRL